MKKTDFNKFKAFKFHGFKKKKTPESMPDVEMLENELVREKHKITYRKAVRTTVYAMIVAAAAAVLVAVLFLPVFKIYGSSMTPTLREGDIVIAVSVKKFKTGDLVGFYHGNKLLVKRCIAGPGQSVDLDPDGNVYINGKIIKEPNIKEKAFGECDLPLPYQVPDKKWFFMGDHRETSIDSRSSSVGCIDEEQIKGKVVFRIWPLDRFGAVK